MHGGLKYRPDIDGLRAIAVILVVMYHLDVGFTKGGFIGVDVFFVISGYLITGIISSETEAKRFSLIGFYERRVRRLFPALFGVFAFSAVMAFVTLFPTELEYFGAQLAAATAFVANILFYNGDGYFRGTHEAIPLLHTWSLAVEEQFYLLYPLALMPLLRRDRGSLCRLTLAGAAAVSFLISLILVKYDRSGAFYLLPSRAWELLTGSLVALGAVPELRNYKLRKAMSLIGLITIIAAAGAINRNTAFPGWAAALPCVGAAMVIHSGVRGDTPVYRLLSSPPAVFVGLISYSLYLWHWPLIVFYKATYGFTLSHLEMLSLGVASLLAAFLSWRYIERPFRTRAVLPNRLPLFFGAGMVMASAMALAVLFVATDGMNDRFPASVRQLAKFRYDPSEPMRVGTCLISRAFAEKPTVEESCMRLDPARRNFLLVGDSHAAHYWAGLTEVYPDINFLQATATGCAPVLGGEGAGRCRSVVDNAYLDFIPNHKLDAVIIAALWSSSDIPGLLSTIKAVRKNVDKVYVFGPIVTYDDLLPRLLMRSEMKGDPSIVTQARQSNLGRLDRAFARAVEGSGAKYVSIYNALCDESGACLTRDHNGDPIQFDNAHLTKAGSIITSSVLKCRGLIGSLPATCTN